MNNGWTNDITFSIYQDHFYTEKFDTEEDIIYKIEGLQKIIEETSPLGLAEFLLNDIDFHSIKEYILEENRFNSLENEDEKCD